MRRKNNKKTWKSEITLSGITASSKQTKQKSKQKKKHPKKKHMTDGTIVFMRGEDEEEAY